MKLLCPNCETPNLYVVETRQSPEIIFRTRKCRACKWVVTTKETFSDEDAIPRNIRRPREQKGYAQ